MKQTWAAAIILAFVANGVSTTTARADPGANDAKSLCSDRIRRDYSASTRSVSTSWRGSDRYSVTGEARRNGETANFTCRTDRRLVQSLTVGSWRRSSSNNGEAVAAVGIAVGLAAIIAAASSKKRNDQYDRYGRREFDRSNYRYYGNDGYSPTTGIICHRAQRACYDDYDNYNARWTQREFGY